MARGGKRVGAGHPSAFSEQQEQKLFERALELTDRELHEMLPGVMKAMRTMAEGEWLEILYHNPTGRERATMTRVEEALDPDGKECLACWHRPDPRMMSLVIEQTRGKAAQKSRVEADVQIVLQHQVPRPKKPDYNEKYDKVLGAAS